MTKKFGAGKNDGERKKVETCGGKRETDLGTPLREGKWGGGGGTGEQETLASVPLSKNFLPASKRHFLTFVQTLKNCFFELIQN